MIACVPAAFWQATGSRPSCDRHTERGAALSLLFLTTLTVAALTATLAARTWHDVNQAARPDLRQAWLDRSATAVRAWYTRHLAETARRSDTLDMRVVLAQANLSPLYAAGAASSVRLSVEGIAGHRMVLWVPGPSGQEARIDPLTGVISAPGDCLVTQISGIDIQRQASESTRRAIARMARSIERWALARRRLELDEIGCNPFRGDVPCQAPGRTLPRLDDYTDAGEIDWAGLGIGDVTTRDAWGGKIEVSTLIGTQTQLPPFSMAIRSLPPYGGEIVMQAIQTL
jgi:hypothetical protein